MKILILLLSLQIQLSHAVVFRDQVQRPATVEEKRLFVDYKSGDAAGVLLSYRYVMVAQHSCRLGHSGSIPKEIGERTRFHAVRVAEVFWEYDVCILEIDWGTTGGLPPKVLFPPKIWTTPEELNVSKDGDLLFHLGNSTEVATYSEGRAKAIGLNSETNRPFLHFNIGSFYGGSGGPIYRKSDLMLVSIMSGPVSKNIYGFADSSDPSAWLQGAALKDLYQKSKTLKKIFPDGSNIYTNVAGEPYRDEIGSLDKFGNRDIIFKKIFYYDFGTIDFLKPLNPPWKTGQAEWQLFSINLKFRDRSCPAGWRLPEPEEFNDAISAGMADPQINTSFGVFINQHPHLSFRVASLDDEKNPLCLRDGKLTSKPPEEKDRAKYMRQTEALFFCHYLCVKSQN